jgi:hypothetical protein
MRSLSVILLDTKWRRTSLCVIEWWQGGRTIVVRHAQGIYATAVSLSDGQVMAFDDLCITRQNKVVTILFAEISWSFHMDESNVRWVTDGLHAEMAAVEPSVAYLSAESETDTESNDEEDEDEPFNALFWSG